ncbi:MAG: InlB B-repeat-containing protein [Butyrivibrio sp.]
MKKHFLKKSLCYLLSLALFTSVLQVPTRAAEGSSYNETGTPEIMSNAAAAGETEKSLDFACDGGTFTEGYQAPDSYPAQKLPDKTVINKPGYAFAGWYDNKDLEGEAVTEVSDADYTGPVVLYAKWTDPYYYVNIPASVVTDGSEIKLSAEAYGLYDQETVKVMIHSENDWNLRSNNTLLSYQLREKNTNMIAGNDVSVMYLTSSNNSEEKVYVCEVTGQLEVAGQYKDTLTFQIGHESKDYKINYEANGGFKEIRKIPVISSPLRQRHLHLVRYLRIFPLPSNPVIHF